MFLKHDITLIPTRDEFRKHSEFLYVNKHAHARRTYLSHVKYFFCFRMKYKFEGGKQLEIGIRLPKTKVKEKYLDFRDRL